MTEQSLHAETPPAEPVATQSTSRWERVRPRGRIGQVAGILVAVAAAIFIAGSIFVAGFALGSEGGGEHHGHGGDGHSQSGGDRDGDSGDGDGPG